MNKLSRNKGITLVSLVITIIVMLILAGVSLSMVMGDNSVLERAQEAVEKTEIANDLEELQRYLLSYNAKVNKNEDINSYLSGKGYICEPYPMANGDISLLIEQNNRYYSVYKVGKEYIAELASSDFKDTTSTFIVASQDNLNEDKTIIFEDDKTSVLIFDDKITDPEFNVEVLKGEVTIFIKKDTVVTNENMGRSAIKIAPNASLTLSFLNNATLTVDSGFGADGDSSTDNISKIRSSSTPKCPRKTRPSLTSVTLRFIVLISVQRFGIFLEPSVPTETHYTKHSFAKDAATHFGGAQFTIDKDDGHFLNLEPTLVSGVFHFYLESVSLETDIIEINGL